jgi:hypothetical protein
VSRHKASLISILISFCAVFLFASLAAGQNKKVSAPTVDVKRTITRHETHRLLYGGSLTVIGAPVGTITIEGWQRSEIDVSAEIELHGPSDADLDRLAVLNNFAVDVDVNHIRIVTTGTHDKKFMKQMAKNFPKTLLGLPWKLDLHLKVPELTDVEIDAGVGAIKIGGVEGAMRLNALQSDAELTLTGGHLSAIIQRGSVRLMVPARSWHGLGADLQLAGGTLDVALAPGFSGDVDATVLRIGEIKNSYSELKPVEGSTTNARSLEGRAGAGGAKLSFTVGDGTIQIKTLSPEQ